MTEIEIDEIEITREKAKEFVSAKNTIKAEKILEQLWMKSSKNDAYLLYEYGNVLRINNKQMEL